MSAPVLDPHAADPDAEAERYAAAVEEWIKTRRLARRRRETVLTGHDLLPLTGLPSGSTVVSLTVENRTGEPRVRLVTLDPTPEETP